MSANEEVRMINEKLRTLLILFLVLGSISTGFSIGMHYLPNMFNLDEYVQAWWSSLFQNVGVSILFGVVIGLFIDKSLKQNELKDREEKRNVALVSLYDILKMQFEAVLFGMYKAAKPEEKTFSNLEGFFSEEYYETVQLLDFTKSPFKDGTPKYYEIIWEHNKYTKELLTEEVLTPFGQYLENDIFQLVQNMRLSPFIKVTQQLPYTAQFFGQFADLIKLSRISNNSVVVAEGYAANYLDNAYNEELMSSLRKHIEIFKGIVKVYNKYAPSDKQLDLLTAPDTGSVTWGCCRIDNIVNGGTRVIKTNFED